MTKPTFNVVNNSNPADRHMAITPSDSTVLDPIPRALKVTVAGNLAIADADGTAVTYPVSAGDIIPTGTTAIVVAWY